MLLHAASLAAEALDVDLPAGSLSDVLLDIGSRYGVIVSFSPALASGKSAAPLSGHFTLEEVLGLALQNSGLEAHVMPAGVVTLQQAAALVPALGEATSAPAPEPEPPDADPSIQRVVIVAAVGPQGVPKAATASATLTDTPLSDIPQAVSIVTADTLEWTGARSINEALAYVSGVSLQYDSMPLAAVATKVRGMPAQYAVDGLPSLSGALFPLDSAILSAIEVLKGPAGVVGGVSENGSRGGVIAAVRKRPEWMDGTRAWTTVDSADGGSVRTGIDLERDTAALAGRVVAVDSWGRRTDAGHDGLRGLSVLAAGTGRSGDVESTLVLEHERHRVPPPPRAALVVDANAATISRVSASATPAIEPGEGVRSTMDSIELDAGWRIAPAWQLKSASRWEWGRLELHGNSFMDIDDDVGVVTQTIMEVAVRQSVHRLTLVGEAGTGPFRHVLLAGADTSLFSLYETGGGGSWAVDPATLEADSAGGEPAGVVQPADPWQQAPLRRRQNGVFLQDQISVGDLRARLGLRRAAFVEQVQGSAVRQVKGSSWDAGLSYRVLPSLTAYFGSQTALEADYRPVPVLLASGDPVPLSRVRQSAVGLKAESGDRRLSASVEAYRMQERDILEVTDGDLGNVVVPGSQARGVEIDVAGKLSRRLDVSLGLSRVIAQNIGSSIAQPLPVPVPVTAVPSRSMYLLARYRLPDEIASATQVGLGMLAHSAMWAVAPDPDGLIAPYRIPGGATFDLTWKRGRGPWTFSAILRNVFDRRLYGADVDTSDVTLLPRRSLSLTLSYEP